MDASDYTEDVDGVGSGTEAEKVNAVSADHTSADLHEVWASVKQLNPTESTIATLRAYGYEWREVGEVVGLHRGAARRRFVDHIAPRLAAELAHLRGVA